MDSYAPASGSKKKVLMKAKMACCICSLETRAVNDASKIVADDVSIRSDVHDPERESPVILSKSLSIISALPILAK